MCSIQFPALPPGAPDGTQVSAKGLNYSGSSLNYSQGLGMLLPSLACCHPRLILCRILSGQ